MSKYFKDIKTAFVTIAGGLKLTLRYLAEARQSRKPIGVEDEDYFEVDKGIVTLEYPYESLPVPDNARYRLHNEIDDCIVCDKCAKVCPVDCIEIEAIKAPEVFGTTSDGTPKRIHAARFDIDMSKCCFCGLCTTVCPTECLTMTKVYDFSEFDVRDHVYSFANMSLTEIAEKRRQAEEAEAAKAKPVAPVVATPTEEASTPVAKPAFKPKVVAPKAPQSEEQTEAVAKAKPVFRPKPIAKPVSATESTAEASADEKEAPKKPVFRPKVMVKPKPAETEETLSAKAEEIPESKEEHAEKKRPVFKPKPMVKPKPKQDDAG